MNSKPQNQESAHQIRAIFWMLVPVGLLVATVGGWLVMVSIAVDDPGFAVEQDYYVRAAHYDDVLEQRRVNRELGYRISVIEFSQKDEVADLELRLLDRRGRPLKNASLSIEVIPVARASERQSITLSGLSDGAYRGVIERPRTGMWEFRVRVEHKQSVFTKILRATLPPDGGPPS